MKPLADMEMAAWKDEAAAVRQEVFNQCKQLAACAEPHGSRWQLLVDDAQRADKCVGWCLCEETTLRSISLECDFSLTRERQPDGSWKSGQNAIITFLPISR